MFDLLIHNGRIMDGTGNPWYRADVGIRGERIAAIGSLGGSEALQAIDAHGQIVCPGFVDPHSHSDLYLLAHPRHEPKMLQGVTTEVLGQDGISYAPVSDAGLTHWRDYWMAVDGRPDLEWGWRSVADFLARFDRAVSPNVAYLVPHGTVRHEVMGLADRPLTDVELRRMEELIAQGMEEGAMGLSTGLTYLPAFYSTTEELVACCQVVARYGGVYVTHLRDYGDHISGAVEEALTIGRRTGVPVHISHFNGRAEECLPLIDRARSEGLDVTFENYPYLAGCTLLSHFLPRWAQAGGIPGTVTRLRDTAARKRIQEEMAGTHEGQWQNYTICAVGTEGNQCYEGLTLSKAAEATGGEVVDFICDLIIHERLAVTVVQHHANRTEGDLRSMMKHRAHMVCTDAILLGSYPHPRGYGTYPRYLGHYVRDEGVLTLEECVRKMTSLPARRFGLGDRGVLCEGLCADVVIFDPDNVRDIATFDDPCRYPVGIETVIVNGEVVVHDGQHTGATPGRALRHQAHTPAAR
jgi:N-acyl-D-amino-acid deacylase